MANLTPASNNTVTLSNAAVFIPEMWSDEIVAAYKKNLVMANLVMKMNHVGKKGDTIHIPSPTRGTASAKGVATTVTLQQGTNTDIPVTIDKHYEYSRLIEDIVGVQAIDSYRAFYTDDAGYALATQVDTDLIRLGRSANGGAGTAAYTGAVKGSDGETAYVAASNNEAALTDAGIRKVIQTLDDLLVPMDNRYLVVPPVEKNNMLGMDSRLFSLWTNTGEQGGQLRTGRIGDVYGVPVYVTTACDTTSGTGGARIALMFHKEWAVLVEQMSVRSQTQYKQEFLADLYTSDTIYGVGEIRNTSCIPIAVAA